MDVRERQSGDSFLRELQSERGAYAVARARHHSDALFRQRHQTEEFSRPASQGLKRARVPF